MEQPTNRHPLTDAEKALIAEIQLDLYNLQQQLQGVLRLALKSRGLEGKWALDGDALVEQK